MGSGAEGPIRGDAARPGVTGLPYGMMSSVEMLLDSL